MLQQKVKLVKLGYHLFDDYFGPVKYGEDLTNVDFASLSHIHLHDDGHFYHDNPLLHLHSENVKSFHLIVANKKPFKNFLYKIHEKIKLHI